MPRVSVIVLNWNGEAYLGECLDSILNQTYSDFELLVVDNASTDGSREWLRERAGGRIRLIELPGNLGYAGGNNRGIEAAKGEWIALVNNDAVLDRFWLKRIMEAVEREDSGSGVGMAASKILVYDRRECIDNTGHLAYPDGLNRGRGRLARDSGQYDEEREALFPSGCAGLYRREMLEETGGFDETFFAYGDDADLGLRGRIMGWRCIFVPRAVVYHRYSASTSAYSPFKAYHVERNRVWVMLKAYPKRMIFLSPVYTATRYLLQGFGALAGRGAAGGYVKERGRFSLFATLIKALAGSLRHGLGMLAKRRNLWANARISEDDMSQLLRMHRLSACEVSLAD